jgi:hypothetical protein
MTKYFAALMLCLAHPAQAWEFTPTPVCTLTDASSPTDLKLTYDGELYTLVLSNAEGLHHLARTFRRASIKSKAVP